MPAQFKSLATETDITYIGHLLNELLSASLTLWEAVEHLNSLQAQLVKKIHLSIQLLRNEIAGFDESLLDLSDYGLLHDPTTEIVDALDLRSTETIPPKFVGGSLVDLKYLLNDLDILIKRNAQVLAAKTHFDELTRGYAVQVKIAQILFGEFVEGQTLETNGNGLLVNDVGQLLKELFPASTEKSDSAVPTSTITWLPEKELAFVVQALTRIAELITDCSLDFMPVTVLKDLGIDTTQTIPGLCSQPDGYAYSTRAVHIDVRAGNEHLSWVRYWLGVAFVQLQLVSLHNSLENTASVQEELRALYPTIKPVWYELHQLLFSWKTPMVAEPAAQAVNAAPSDQSES